MALTIVFARSGVLGHSHMVATKDWLLLTKVTGPFEPEPPQLDSSTMTANTTVNLPAPTSWCPSQLDGTAHCSRQVQEGSHRSMALNPSPWLVRPALRAPDQMARAGTVAARAPQVPERIEESRERSAESMLSRQRYFTCTHWMA